MKLAQALAQIADDIDRNIGWNAAAHYYRAGLLSHDEYDMLNKFGRLDDSKVELTPREQNARRKINERILNSISELELYEIGIDVEELTVAKNGWRHNYELR